MSLVQNKLFQAALFLFMFCTLSFAAQAKTLYVDGARGSDATSYADNSAQTPWQTIGRAAWGSTDRTTPNASQAAQAGDIVSIAAGTYTTIGTNSRYTPAYNPANSGTAQNPITFEADGTVVLTLSSEGGPVIGSYMRNYIVWRGFTINEANATTRADTGPVVFWASTGGRIENSDLDGNGDPGYGDNHPGVRINNADNITVRNNRIHNFYTSVVNPMNGVGVQVYESKGLTIENNEIFDVGSGVFFKGIGFSDTINGRVADPARYSDMQDVVRNNLIYNARVGIIQHRHLHTSSDVYFLAYQNVIRNCGTGLHLRAFPNDGPTNGRFFNNTVDGCTIGIGLGGSSEFLPNANNLIQNNLVTNSLAYAFYNESSTTSFMTERVLFDRTWYSVYPRFMEDMYVRMTYDQFRATYPAQEVNGVNGSDPLYVDRANGDFHLSANSPVLAAGRAVHGVGGADGTVIPVGAYITGNEVIGLTTNVVTPPPPAPDTTAPTASITSPAADATVNNTVAVTADASDDAGVAGVELYVNGAFYERDTTAPYSFSWDTNSLPNGTATLSARAVDAAGNSGTSAGVQVTVNNVAAGDTTPPVVTLLKPPSGVRIKSITKTVTVLSTATDNVGVASMKLYVDGRLVTTVLSSTLSYKVKVTKWTRGSHTIAVTATDAAGNESTATAIVYK